MPHGRVVLLHGDRRHGTWTGQLRRWQRHDGTWYGAVVWDQLGIPRSALVHATRLRPLAVPRVVLVWLHDDWQHGRLTGWRKQPSYSYWEAEVELDAQPGADWYRQGLVRPSAAAPLYSNAY